MYEAAGEIYAEHSKFEDAARCFFDAKVWDKAKKYYEEAKQYTKATDACIKGGRYDEVVDLMQR